MTTINRVFSLSIKVLTCQPTSYEDRLVAQALAGSLAIAGIVVIAAIALGAC